MGVGSTRGLVVSIWVVKLKSINIVLTLINYHILKLKIYVKNMAIGKGISCIIKTLQRVLLMVCI
jgi:hypothetical protein